MPEFLSEYIRELSAVVDRIRAYDRDILNDVFRRYWLPFPFGNMTVDGEVLAVDSSSAKHATEEGGVFYVVRAMALSNQRRYRKVSVGYDFSPNFHDLPLISRIMEHLEHAVAKDAIEDGFDDIILMDGSLYGRMSHLLKETDFVERRALMVDYFEMLHSFLDACRRNGITVVSISKESRTSFFRTFLVGKAIEEMGVDDSLRGFIMQSAIERTNISNVLRLAESRGIAELVMELIRRQPDFQMILKYARSIKKTGCTTPLLLGATARWHREYNLIKNDAENFIRRRFPVSSATDDGFVERVLNVMSAVENLPAVVSFHVLPALNDTPMRVDVPAWMFNINKRMCDVRMPESISGYDKLKEIIELISAGYCDLRNYNIWLSAVDSAVKLRKDVFENVYLRKFEEFIGIYSARGDRRARFP
ncbi:hypothetical protein DRN79_03025 [Methanosarcinales archaeon]|nr:MAG: hypothetical protein DRN79_03025 [Methanosarcinales archaeon]